MADGFLDINTEGRRSGTSNITNSGRVVVNGYKDDLEIERRRRAIQNKRALFSGPTEDDQMSILPWEIALGRRTGRGKRHYTMSNANFALTSLNGAGRLKNGNRTDAAVELIEDLHFKGISGARALHDTKNQNPEVDLPLIVGGLVTMQNTGTLRINNGDFLYWDLPTNFDNPDSRIKPRNGGKFLVETVPFDPKLDRLTKEYIKGRFTDKLAMPPRSPPDSHKTFTIAKGADELEKSLLNIVLFSWIAGLRSGVFKYRGATSFGSSEDAESMRDQNAGSYSGVSNDAREEIIVKMAKSLGVIESRDSYNVSVPVRGGGGDKEHMSVKNVALSVLYSMNDFTVIPEPIARVTDMEKVYDKQSNVLDNLFVAIAQANHFKTKRIFGRAMTPAPPGRDMDVLIGGYSV